MNESSFSSFSSFAPAASVAFPHAQSPSAPPRPILVYSDQAAQTATAQLLPQIRAAFPHRPVVTADSVTLGAAIAHSSAAAIVLPGICGENCSYYDRLGGDSGQRRLAAFVEKGGLLVTVCAGSYLVARKTEYLPPWGPAKERTNAAPIFNAVARGPVTGAARPGGPAWYEDCSVVPVSYRAADGAWRQTAMAYGNGPALYPDADMPGMEILARYDDVPDSPPAAAWLAYGRGAVLWLGVLPYMGHEPVGPGKDFQKIRDLMAQLKPHETERRLFWDTLMRRAENHLRGMDAPTPRTGPAPLGPA